MIVDILSLLNFAITVTAATSLSKPGCQDKCGNVTIPYPFGIGPQCSYTSWFEVVCRDEAAPFLPRINAEVLNISLYGTVIVNQPVSPMNCTDAPTRGSLLSSLEANDSPFSISSRYNKWIMLGCKSSVWLVSDENTTAGCTSVCDANQNDTSCNGVNCCQMAIPSQTQEIQYIYQSITGSKTSYHCGYAFPADVKWLQNDYARYRGFVRDLSNPFDPEFVSAPLVIDWSANSQSEYVGCRYPGDTFETLDVYNEFYSFPYYFSETEYVSSSYYCSCLPGFEGSPYLPQGCRDIDECSNATLNYCISSSTCINMPGYYKCVHPRGNRYRVKIAVAGAGSALGAVVLLLGAWLSARAISRTIQRRRRQNFFKRNGGLLLEQHLSSTRIGFEKTKVFSARELAQATDHYNENRILGRGGQGTVYKGMLTDGRIVAIKKSKKVDDRDLQVFINEVVVLSQINHRNVVELLGCCLETEVPLLVYEFVPNGTLFQHIHHPSEDFSLSWEMRLQIAREAAGAVAYLHSAASTPIYHRDIKSTNILLDFGTSRTVAIDQSHVTTRVLGTFGYLDPEYFQSSHFTEKSDVYSFGVVMVELLTGEKAVSSVRAEAGRNLATHFLHLVEEDQLLEIVDVRVLKEGKAEDIVAMAGIARRCLHANGRQRPTMKEVAGELEGIRIQMLKQDSVCPPNHYQGRESHSIEIVQSADFSSISGR